MHKPKLELFPTVSREPAFEKTQSGTRCVNDSCLSLGFRQLLINLMAINELPGGLNGVFGMSLCLGAAWVAVFLSIFGDQTSKIAFLPCSSEAGWVGSAAWPLSFAGQVAQP